MKKLSFLTMVAASMLLAAIIPTARGQVIYSEDFDNVGGPTSGGAGTYSFPANMLKRNVDNLTPNAAVSYVNEAWERREDFSFNTGDSCAFSTSWYSPAGTANDFMWTPAIGPLPANCLLSWNGVAYDPAYPDGYEVRIMTVTPTGGTGTIGNQITNSTILWSTLGEATTWTNHQISLAAYAGQTVYIGFRNNSTDMFLLLIDDILVEVPNNYDAAVLSTTPISEYTMIPKQQVTPLTLGGSIKNQGALSITNVRMKADVYNSSNTLVYTTTSAPVASMATLTTQNFVCGTFTPTVPDYYLVEYMSLINETDETPSNDTLADGIIITDTTYARDDATVAGSLGIGAGNGGYLGQQFTINTATDIRSVSYYVTGGYHTDRTAVVVWNMVGGVPSTVIASTDTIYYPDDSARLYTLPIYGGPYTLVPGEYVVTAVEFDSTLRLATTDAIYTATKTWVNWPTNPNGTWSHNEDFSFIKSYILRPNLYTCAVITAGVTKTDASCATCPDGSATANPSNGVAPYSFLWNTTDTTAGLTLLMPGTYTVTITDAFGCQATESVTVSFNTGIEEFSNEFNVMPNPNNGLFELVFTGNPGDNASIEICSIVGEVIYKQSIENNGSMKTRINLGDIASGCYMLRYKSNDHIAMKRLIIK
ncbi:MAG: choice-of-anchor J domain-containing protein [Bacteroidota bacterium]